MVNESVRLDPAASFNAEIARIGAEHNADVVFYLVEREDKPMAAPMCCLNHNEEAVRIFTAKCPGHETKHNVALCQDHADAMIRHDKEAYDKSPSKANVKEEWRYMAANKESRLTSGRDPHNRDGGRGSGDSGDYGLTMRTTTAEDHRGRTILKVS